MKRLFLSVIALIAIAGCSQNSIILPPPVLDNPPSHAHDWGNPVDYELSGDTLYAIYQCECGEVKKEIISSSSNTIVATGIDAEEALAKVTRGSTIIVDNTSAQKALDLAMDGCTIYFSADTYTGGETDGFLFVRPGKNNVNRIVNHSKPDENVEVGSALDTGAIYYYYSELNGVKLIADDDAVFDCALWLTAGHIHTEGSYDAVRGQKVEAGVAGSYFAHMAIDNLEISNFHFSGEGNNIYFQYALHSDVSYLDGLRILGCEFNGTGSTNTDMAIRLLTDIGIENGYVWQNISIEDCVMNGCYQGLYVQNAHNISVTGCDISNTTHNGIAIQNGGDASSSTDTDVFSGDIEIKGNTITNTGDRAIRFGDGQDAVIEISENIFISPAYDAARELLKSGTLQDCSYTFTGNALDDVSISNVSGSESSWIVSV